jgi:hypothetical protein
VLRLALAVGGRDARNHESGHAEAGGRLGISMVQVTDELEQEGLKAFADAFAELVAAVEAWRQGAIRSAGKVAA